MANQTLFSTAAVLQWDQRRNLLIFALSFLSISVMGCTSSRTRSKSIWPQTSATRAAAKSADSSKSTAKKETATEPAMSANVAVTAETPEETTSSRVVKNDNRPKSSPKKPETRPGDSKFYKIEITPNSKPDIPFIPSSESIAETAPIDSSLERLNSVLSDDVLQSESLPQGSLTELADRLRIDSLVSQAKNLLQSGQLEQARQKAQLAQELSQKVQIEYAPDEDRPIDLVRRIQGQLEATRPKEESDAQDGMAESPNVPAKIDKNDAVTTTSKPDAGSSKDASSLARIRRDWSTLFRQKKKQTPHEPAPASPTFERSPPSTSPVVPELQARRNAKSQEMDAIVVANRSVSLGAPDSMTASSASYTAEDRVRGTSETDSTGSDPSASLDLETPLLPDLRDNPASESSDATRPNIDVEDASDAATDFDVAEPTVPFLNVKSSTFEERKPDQLEPGDSDEDPDWTGFYIGFGLCALLAVGVYRRGTA